MTAAQLTGSDDLPHRARVWRRASALSSIGVCLAIVLAGCNRSPDAPAADLADGTNWQNYGRTYNDDHFSPLTEVNDKTVQRLGLAWSYDLDTFDSFTAPLAIDGVLYFAVGDSVVHAMDAKTGKLLWKHDPEVYKVAGKRMRAGWGIRGIAFDKGKVFTGTRDGRLIALDARNGQLLWSVMTLKPEDEAAYISGPPWVFRGKVMIGFGGADYGAVRGYVKAYDQESGRQARRFYTVPGDPKKGFEDSAQEMAAKTWTGEWWKWGGGGTVWHAMNYDPVYNRVYLGTGNGFPWNQKIRSPGGGDNLFLSSIVALDADTGKYVWHYQANPANTWDYNNNMDIQLAEVKIDGKPRHVLLHAPKNGFFYVIDRADGKLISAEKFARVNWADRIDPKSGRPVENPAARYADGKPFVIFPSTVGAHAVQTMSYSPATGLAYIPAIEMGNVFVDPPNVKNWDFRRGVFFDPGNGAPPPGIQLPAPETSLVAFDPIKGKVMWRLPQSGNANGGTIVTAGNLVFQGLSTGEFVAYAANDGRKLWGFQAQNGILGNAITYRADGKQYVTVITGWRRNAPIANNWEYRQQKRRVLTFVLDSKATLPPLERFEEPILDDPKLVIDPAKVAIGQKIASMSCRICHGVELRSGGAAPDLRKSPVPLDANAFRSVVHGGALISRGMPRYEELTDAELEGVRHYIRQRARQDLNAARPVAATGPASPGP